MNGFLRSNCRISSGRMGSPPRLFYHLLPPNLRLQNVLEPLLDLLVRLVHFLVGQGAIVCLVGEGISEAFGAGRDAGAAIKVEEADNAEQIAAGRSNFGAD